MTNKQASPDFKEWLLKRHSWLYGLIVLMTLYIATGIILTFLFLWMDLNYIKPAISTILFIFISKIIAGAFRNYQMDIYSKELKGNDK